MKTLLLAMMTLLASSTFASTLIESYPTLSITDALGTKRVSIKNFCMTDDGSKLIGMIRYCKKAAHIGRGYKKCTSRATIQRVEIENDFSYTVNGPRGRSTTYNYSYDRDIVVDIIEFDPRGYREKVDDFIYTIPNC